jgi:hypothetical protein
VQLSTRLKRGRQRCSHAASLLRVQHIFDAYTALVDLLVLRLSLWVEPHPELCAVGNQRLGYIDEGFLMVALTLRLSDENIF